MDSPFVPSFVAEKESRKREGELERGLFIERGRKPECAADKELAKRDREGERLRGRGILDPCEMGRSDRRSGGRGCVFGGCFTRVKRSCALLEGWAGQSHDLAQGSHL